MPIVTLTRFLIQFRQLDDSAYNMTDSVDFNELKMMMPLLKQLRAEVDSGNWSRRDLCIQMHEEVSRKLVPLFEELAAMDMLVLHTKADGDTPADVSNLEVDGINGGIQLTKKAADEEDDDESSEGLVLTQVHSNDPDKLAFTFEF